LHEKEADAVGVLLCAKAGYNPAAAVRVFERMADEELKRSKGVTVPGFLSTVRWEGSGQGRKGCVGRVGGREGGREGRQGWVSLRSRGATPDLADEEGRGYSGHHDFFDVLAPCFFPPGLIYSQPHPSSSHSTLPSLNGLPC
jgi:hypothetical protein